MNRWAMCLTPAGGGGAERRPRPAAVSEIRIAAAIGGGASGTSSRKPSRCRARSSSERQAGTTSTNRNSAARSSRRGTPAPSRGRRAPASGGACADGNAPRPAARRRAGSPPPAGGRPRARRCDVARSAPEDVDRSGDDQTRSSRAPSATAALISHLAIARQRHRVGGAERGRVRERHVEVVHQARLPARRCAALGSVICGNRKSGMRSGSASRAAGRRGQAPSTTARTAARSSATGPTPEAIRVVRRHAAR